MRASHRVKNSEGEATGFMIDGRFYTDYEIKEKAGYIENLTVQKDGAIEPETPLPEMGYKEAVNSAASEKIERENPFRRDIQEEFRQWKSRENHGVLQLEGARQTGKTTELLRFAYKSYEYVIYVDITRDNGSFAEFVDSPCTALDMEVYCRKAKLPHFVDSKKTILIIDEIQESARTYNAIRTMHRELACDLAVTGSYLGRVVANKEFFLPAGTVELHSLLPLSFREFCRVFQCEETLDKVDLYGGGDSAEYEVLDRAYELYRRIGGYPEAVKRYLGTRDMEECHNVIGNLLHIFKEESRHYFQSSREVEVFEPVYEAALNEMCREKRGSGKGMLTELTDLTYAKTKELVGWSEVGNAVVWLKYCGILNTCDLAVDGDLRDVRPGRRLYFSDCGIASYLAKRSMLDMSALEGMITETFVYNELHRLFKEPYPQQKVRLEEVCFSTYDKYELDFMVASRDRTVYGFEVKTSKGAPTSLRVFVDRQFVDRGIVVKATKGGRGEYFDTIPIYAVGCRFPYEQSG